MNERELLVDCLRRLNRTGVAYYLTGSMASNYWGVPRTTHDLDLLLEALGKGVATCQRAGPPVERRNQTQTNLI
ncbi:MAG: hypothetical protein ABSC18_10875 [Verrucomicrobiota bacterium]|jgi:hypothetical protein